MLTATPQPREIVYCPDADFDFREHFFAEQGSLEAVSDDLQICVMYHPSRQRIGSADKPFLATSPSTMISAPGVLTVLDWQGAGATVPVRISPRFVESALDSPFDPARILTRSLARTRDVDNRDVVIEHIVSAMVAEARSGFPAGLVFQQTMALALIHQALVPSATSAGMPRKCGGLSTRQLQRVVGLIDADLSVRLNLVDLAACLNVSTRYLCKAFKASTGMSPYQYILCRRVEHARKLIETGDVPLSHVALSAGFSDHSQMSATFRRLLGKPPSFFVR